MIGFGQMMMAAAAASVAATKWFTLLGGMGAQAEFTALDVDGSNNVYAVGANTYTNSYAFAAKFDSAGTLLWQRRIGAAAYDKFHDCCVDGSGNLYACGIEGSSADANNVFVVKFDTNGNLTWQRRLSGSGGEIGYGIDVDGSGNVYVTGNTQSNNALLAKWDASGTIQYIKELDYGSSDVGFGIRVDGSGNIFIAGFGVGTPAKGFLTKLNSSASVVWEKQLSHGSDSIQFYDLEIDGSGNLYAVGYNYDGVGSTIHNAILTKWDSSGALQWQRLLGGAYQDIAYGVAIDGSGNVYVSGSEKSNTSNSNFEAFIAKYNSSGTLQWQRRLSGSNAQLGGTMRVRSDGTVLVCGGTEDPSNGGWISVVDPNGPTAGTITGITGMTWAASSLTDSTPAYTAGNSAVSISASGMTSVTPSFTVTTTTYTPTYGSYT